MKYLVPGLFVLVKSILGEYAPGPGVYPLEEPTPPSLLGENPYFLLLSTK